MEDTERMPLLPGSRRRVANCSLTKLSLLIFALGSLALGAGAAITLSIMKADPDHRNTTTTTTTTTKRPGMNLKTIRFYKELISLREHIILRLLPDGVGEPGLIRSGGQGEEDGSPGRVHRS